MDTKVIQVGDRSNLRSTISMTLKRVQEENLGIDFNLFRKVVGILTQLEDHQLPAVLSVARTETETSGSALLLGWALGSEVLFFVLFSKEGIGTRTGVLEADSEYQPYLGNDLIGLIRKVLETEELPVLQ
jgi:hypothetical protein